MTKYTSIHEMSIHIYARIHFHSTEYDKMKKNLQPGNVPQSLWNLQQMHLDLLVSTFLPFFYG